MRLRTAGVATVVCCTACGVSAQSDIADIPSKEVVLPTRKGSPEAAYFFIGPKEGAEPPSAGYGLLVVLPGGGGGREFNTFVKRIYKHVLGDDWIAAQLVALSWVRSKEIVWPTANTPGRGAVPCTEDFVEAVITDAARRAHIDPARVFVLAWSSSGPAAYALSLRRHKSVTGFYIAMSVFKRRQLPPLKEAKGEAYCIQHSPTDAVCPFRMAKEAKETLEKVKASVKFITYEGGHGWHDNPYGRMRSGIEWLEKNHAPPDARMWGRRTKRKKE